MLGIDLFWFVWCRDLGFLCGFLFVCLLVIFLFK